MKKLVKSMVAAFLVGLLSGPQYGYGAASGNYTDLLPIGAASDTTIISRGSGWAVTTLPTSATFGDALSRLSYTAYQSTTAVNVTATTVVTTFTAISGQGSVGSTSFPASWVAPGRSFRISARGRITTTSGQQSMVWGLSIGTMSVVSSSSPVSVSVASQSFKVDGIFTIAGTGSSGSINGGYDIFMTTAATGANLVSYSTQTASAQTVDLDSQLTINPTFQWRSSSQGNNIQFNTVTVEFLN